MTDARIFNDELNALERIFFSLVGKDGTDAALHRVEEEYNFKINQKEVVFGKTKLNRLFRINISKFFFFFNLTVYMKIDQDDDCHDNHYELFYEKIFYSYRAAKDKSDELKERLSKSSSLTFLLEEIVLSNYHKHFFFSFVSIFYSIKALKFFFLIYLSVSFFSNILLIDQPTSLGINFKDLKGSDLGYIFMEFDKIILVIVLAFQVDEVQYKFELTKYKKHWFEDVILPLDVKDNPDKYLKPGDYVIVSRDDKYYHHAIYSDKKKVIHVRRFNSEIIEDDWMVFYGEIETTICKRIFIYRQDERNKNEIILVARSLIGPIKNQYSLFKRNCRHFAHYCATGSHVGNEIMNHSLSYMNVITSLYYNFYFYSIIESEGSFYLFYKFFIFLNYLIYFNLLLPIKLKDTFLNISIFTLPIFIIHIIGILMYFSRSDIKNASKLFIRILPALGIFALHVFISRVKKHYRWLKFQDK
jgi:hypothetical protein